MTIEDAKQLLREVICQRGCNTELSELSLEKLIVLAEARKIPFIISVDLMLDGWDKINSVHKKVANLVNYIQSKIKWPEKVDEVEFEFTYEGADAPFTDPENNVFAGSITQFSLLDEYPFCVNDFWPDIDLIHSIRVAGSDDEWTEV